MQISHFAAAFGLVALAAGGAVAENYPDRPITLIAPFTAGGASDVLARALADGLGKELGQAVIVENHEGAGGTIGVGLTAAAQPDGYTVVLGGNGSLVFSAGVYKLPYDVRTDLRPVSEVAVAQSAVVVRAGLEVETVDELVARAKEEPKLTYGSPGVGSALHLAGALFGRETGTQLVHVPYKGLAPALTDLQAGNIDVVFANITTLVPFLEGDRLRPIAVIDDKPAALLPDLPTMADAGFPGVKMLTWYGVMAPAGVEDAKIARLEAGIAKVMQDPAFLETLASQGFEPAADPSTAAFDALVKSDFETWLPLIASLGLAPK
jgi:tripartite-type tricarboxylate transporter receptor subunit TctC